jgi:serine O-acetyltransferase
MTRSAGRRWRDAARRGVELAREDIAVVREKDPAATNTWEVLLYPHLHALWLHRLAHRRYLRGHRVSARALAFAGRWVSGGIDIHPGARIGRRFFIDHGTGVVIGETVEIGTDVMLYHLVTLGSVGWWRDQQREPGAKRHPTLGDHVVIGTGACVLGPVHVGARTKVGAHALVLTDVPADANVPAHARPASAAARLARTEPNGSAPAETPPSTVGRYRHDGDDLGDVRSA